jgi:hypothetical protein
MKCELCGQEIHSMNSAGCYRKGDIVVIVLTSQESLFKEDKELKADEETFETRRHATEKFEAALIEDGFNAGDVAQECVFGD